MSNPILTIARYTFYEALRNRLLLLTVSGLLILLGLTEFIGDLAITETAQIQASLIGSGMRIFTVFTVALFVITSMVREFNDKGMGLMLSLPVTRAVYYAGKFFGFFLLALMITMATAALLLIYSEFTFIAVWSFSLLCEMGIIIALSMLCLFTFHNVTVSFLIVALFYFLSRSIYAIQLISSSPILDYKTFAQEFINYLVDAIAYILPDLHVFTRSDWLVHGVDGSSTMIILAQTVIYIFLLAAAGLFDLYRKDL